MEKKNLEMKCLFIVLMVLLANSLGYAQSFSVGHAVPLWGNTTQAVQVDASFGYITTSYIHIYENNFVDELGTRANTDFLAIFFSPIIDEEAISAIPEFLSILPMIGVMNEPYPNENGRKLHFGISLSVEIIDNLDLYYKHISNGYLGETNLGIDTVGLKVKL